MTRIENSYIFRDFNEVEADLVYRLKFQGQDVIFYLLIELQSSVDFRMPYRLLEYMVGIWRDVVKNIDSKVIERKDYRLPAIVPIVLYNGAGPWTACRSFRETLAEAEQFGEYLIDFKYILIDVNRYDKKVLLDLSNLIGTVFLLDQSITQEEYLRRLGELGTVLKKFDAKSFQSFAVWFKDISSSILPQKSREEMCRILDQYKSEEVEQVVSNMEQTLRKMYEDAKVEGRIEGKIEGKTEGKEEIVKNLLSKDMDEKFISEISGFSIERIRDLRNQMKH